MLRRWMSSAAFPWFERNRRLAEDFDTHAATLACFVTLASIQAARQGLGRSPRCTATKVGKSDCEGTFARASGNDEDASISGRSLDRVGAALFDRKQPLKSDIVQAE
jgi:hypothetical protein